MNFGFLEDYCSFHMSNVFRLNFSEFHRFFSKFSKNRQDRPPLIFLLYTNFQTLDPRHKTWWTRTALHGWGDQGELGENSAQLKPSKAMSPVGVAEDGCVEDYFQPVWFHGW
jgi:hypothetical protein